MAYCIAQDVRDRLNITNGSSVDDAVLESLAVACSELVDRYCMFPTGAFAVSANTIRYYDACAVRGQILRLGVPLADTTVTVVNGDGTTLSSNAYRLFPRNEMPKWEIWLLSNYTWQMTDIDSEISVTGKFGVALSTDTPAGIVEATAEYAAWSFKRYQSALQDASANLDLGQLVYSEPMPKQVISKLSGYRNKVGML